MTTLAISARMVGGFVGTGHTFEARARWALTMGSFMAFATAVHHQGWWAALIVFILSTIGTYLGRLIGHSPFQNGIAWWQTLGMCAVGVARLALILMPYAVMNWAGFVEAPVLFITHPLVMFDLNLWRVGMIACGLWMGVAYRVGIPLDGQDCGIYYRRTADQWRIASASPEMLVAIPNDNPEALDQCAVGGTEWGELLTGWMVYDLPYVAMLLMP